MHYEFVLTTSHFRGEKNNYQLNQLFDVEDNLHNRKKNIFFK